MFKFIDLTETYKPSSLWSFFSMLKLTVQQHNNINIDYPRLNSFLKKYKTGFVQKKSLIFDPEDVRRFLDEAPDSMYLHVKVRSFFFFQIMSNYSLFVKVILIFGIFGATRGDELTKVCVEHLVKQGDIYVVKIPDTKTKQPRSFVLEGENATYVNNYLKLRPMDISTNRFFISYKNGKCAKQVIGKNTIQSAPKTIAKFLNLDNPSGYTGHSFRRSSATILADAGADLLMLKRHGGWKSSTVAEGYVAESVGNKRKIGQLISDRIEMTKTKKQKVVAVNEVHNGSMSSVEEQDETTSTSFVDSECQISDFVTDDCEMIGTTQHVNETIQTSKVTGKSIIHSQQTSILKNMKNIEQKTDKVTTGNGSNQSAGLQLYNCTVSINFH